MTRRDFGKLLTASLVALGFKSPAMPSILPPPLTAEQEAIKFCNDIINGYLGVKYGANLWQAGTFKYRSPGMRQHDNGSVIAEHAELWENPTYHKLFMDDYNKERA